MYMFDEMVQNPPFQLEILGIKNEWRKEVENDASYRMAKIWNIQ